LIATTWLLCAITMIVIQLSCDSLNQHVHISFNDKLVDSSQVIG
jgi:hypothetical protein